MGSQRTSLFGQPVEERSVGHPSFSASHTASVLPLILQRGGWTTPGQASRGCSPRREIPLRCWPTDHIVPTPRVSAPALPAVPMSVEVGALIGCLGAIRANPSGVRDHGFTEQLPADQRTADSSADQRTRILVWHCRGVGGRGDAVRQPQQSLRKATSTEENTEWSAEDSL